MLSRKIYLWVAMEEEDEGLGRIPTGHVVEVEAVRFDILVLAERGVQHAVRWTGAPLALEEEERVAQEHL